MARKRVHEIAKAEGLTSKEVLAALKAAGIEATAAASSVEEEDALKALSSAKGDGAAAAPAQTATQAKPKKATTPKGDGKAPAKPEPAAPASKRPVRRGDGAGSTAKAGGKRRRRVVIDSQASRRDEMRQAPPPRPPRRRGGRRRRPLLEEPPEKAPVEAVEPEAIKVPSGATVREVGELLGLGSSEVIKKLMTMGEMATLTQTLTDDSIKAIADEYDRKIEIVTAADEEP
jgi:translation initiation factor IF-2